MKFAICHICRWQCSPSAGTQVWGLSALAKRTFSNSRNFKEKFFIFPRNSALKVQPIQNAFKEQVKLFLAMEPRFFSKTMQTRHSWEEFSEENSILASGFKVCQLQGAGVNLVGTLGSSFGSQICQRPKHHVFSSST